MNQKKPNKYVHTNKSSWRLGWSILSKELHVKPSPFPTIIIQDTVGENILSSIPSNQHTPIPSKSSHQFPVPVSVNKNLQLLSSLQKNKN